MKVTYFILSALLFALTPESYAVHCSDFYTQKQAQEYMERHGAQHLDRDGDGEACECLPGGSKYGRSICNRSKR